MDDVGDLVFLLPQWVTPEDIEQEHAIRLWLKLPSSKRVLRAKFARKGEICFGEFPPGSQPLFQSESWEAKVRLIANWADDQDEEIQQLVSDFLADPTEDLVDEIISLLPSTMKIKKKKDRTRKKSLRDVLLETIRNEPQRQEDLYPIARAFLIHSERPEAAARQTLRVLKRQGLIQITGDLITYIGKEDGHIQK